MKVIAYKEYSFFRRQAYGPGYSKRRRQLITCRRAVYADEKIEATLPRPQRTTWTPREDTVIETLKNLNEARDQLGKHYASTVQKLLTLLP